MQDDDQDYSSAEPNACTSDSPASAPETPANSPEGGQPALAFVGPLAYQPPPIGDSPPEVEMPEGGETAEELPEAAEAAEAAEAVEAVEGAGLAVEGAEVLAAIVAPEVVIAALLVVTLGAALSSDDNPAAADNAADQMPNEEVDSNTSQCDESETKSPAPETPAKADPCPKLIQDLRDAIDRNKREFNNRGMHGLKYRWQELIDGPCGPGQLPYRVNSKGEYVKSPVWENHVEEFNSTKRALRNRFDKVVESGCTVPEDLLDEAAEADNMQPPTPDQWKGDPARPCVDSDPPPGWMGPPEPPGSRGL